MIGPIYFSDCNVLNHAVLLNCKILEEELIHNEGKIVTPIILVIWSGTYSDIYLYLIEYVEYFSDN